jgi:hypothetical protein
VNLRRKFPNVQPPGFPSGYDRDESERVPAKTTFYASDAEEYRIEHRFDHYYLVHHGLFPKKWDRQLRDDPWCVPERNHRVDPEQRFKRIRLSCLSSDFSDPERKWAVDRVMRLGQNEMNRFSRHYAGLVGAFLSALLTVRAENSTILTDPETRVNSWFETQVLPYAEHAGIDDPSGLIEMARRTWEEWE